MIVKDKLFRLADRKEKLKKKLVEIYEKMEKIDEEALSQKIGFITKLYVEDLDDKFSRLTGALAYHSDLLDVDIWIPAGFTTDFSSVPRVPIAFWFWGGRAHREAVLHDYLYRVDSLPKVSFGMANKIFLEAMESRGKPLFVRLPMYAGVCAGGWFSYHKHKVKDGVEELSR